MSLMPRSSHEQKRIEAWYLAAARLAGVPIPHGGLQSEGPDFRFELEDGSLGIELTEVLRPGTCNHGILPVEEESFHREIIDKAQNDYYSVPNSTPVHVAVYFSKTHGRRDNKEKLAGLLSRFVRANVHLANPVVHFPRKLAPDGFNSVVIAAESNPSDWWSGEVGGIAVAEIQEQVIARITAKDALVSSYRSNLPDDSELWLLLYSGVTVARSVPIPFGIDKWRIPFRFDRVFWFASLECQFAEIRKK